MGWLGIDFKEAAMKDNQITNEGKQETQLRAPSPASAQIKGATDKTAADAKMAFYKSVQELRREIRMRQTGW